MRNILIVDNDPNIRKMIRVNLVKRGYAVSEAEDCRHAITCFQKQAVDLVVLDFISPMGPSVDVCSWIRARSDIPIIVISAWLGQDLKVAAFKAGADEYITKPFGPDELLPRVSALLGSSEDSSHKANKVNPDRGTAVVTGWAPGIFWQR
jgi:two-component system, OmpR family, KDP operon response regulator KdpE